MAGFTTADIEAGEVGLEEGILMASSDKMLVRALEDADHRLEKHRINESNRIEAGLPTDLSRWIATGKAVD